MTHSAQHFDVAIIGAGNIGIAVAYYLVKNHGVRSICLIEPLDPMSLTSAQSGENYRNWWPHPTMAAFTNQSIDLLEDICKESGDRINMTRRGYVLATRRSNPSDLIEELYAGYGDGASASIRVHDTAFSPTYAPPLSVGWEGAPDGVDVLLDQAVIRKSFPSFSTDISSVLHIRRAGSISGQQLGQFMLERIRSAGGRLIRGSVTGIEKPCPFRLTVKAGAQTQSYRAEQIVNAAGPYFKDIGSMIGETLPVKCIYQQKISFEDREAAIPRGMPFSIDLDGQEIDWSDEERSILGEDPAAAKLLLPMPGAIHCRPDGPENGRWIKVGWAYNQMSSDPREEDPIDSQFPDTVLRGASRLNPELKIYIGRLPRNAHHYGGYYTMTEENWPLIGPMETAGAFMAGALSGFGTMAACATGLICAAWVAGADIPAYAYGLSAARYGDPALMETIARLKKGHL